MKLLKTFVLAGLVGVGMVSNGFSFAAGMNLQRDCTKAETIFMANYLPKRPEPFVFKEFLYGKNSSQAQLALMEAKANCGFWHPCEIIIFANYRKYDDGTPTMSRWLGTHTVATPRNENVFFYFVRENQVLVPNGKNVPLDELKGWIKEKESTKPPISL